MSKRLVFDWINVSIHLPEAYEEAFNNLKQCLISASITDFVYHLLLRLTAQILHLGPYWFSDKMLKFICYFSSSLMKYERKYSLVEKQITGVVFVEDQKILLKRENIFCINGPLHSEMACQHKISYDGLYSPSKNQFVPDVLCGSVQS